MKNLKISGLLLFLISFFSTSYAQNNCVMAWSFDSINNNLTVADKSYLPTGNLCIRIGTSQKFWLPKFMEEEQEAGIYARPILVNGKPFTGMLTGNYRTEKTAFVIAFAQGIRNGNATFYDTKGKEIKKTYIAANHTQYKAPLTAEEIRKQPTRSINDLRARKEGVIQKDAGEETRSMKKPVIYLYPTEKTEISVKLDFNQKQLTHTYPKYNPEKGWKVIAEPNGDLKNAENGKNYYSLFWEAESQKSTEIKQGFVVKGENTAEFLEEKLAILGLNWRESNEFIMYWLPQMENNNYNLIHFSTEEYSSNFPVTITPQPDNFIRVFMVFEPLEKAIEMPTQELKAAKRGGFTAVEWGGTKQEKPKF